MRLVTVGIIGIEGKYGKWLKKFLEGLGHTVIGSDRGTETTNQEVVEQADVVIFSVWPKATVEVIEQLVSCSRPEQLWLDITSLKEGPVEAMLKSKAEVIGLHPMCAPTVQTWRGQNVAICPVRCVKWLDWVLDLLKHSQATVRLIAPGNHDEKMAFVQGSIHAVHLIIAMVLREMEVDARATLEFATPPFRIVLSTISRILGQDPGLYSDIQFLNRHILPMLEVLVEKATEFRDMIKSGEEEKFLEEFRASCAYLGPDIVQEGSGLFEHIVRLMADLTRENSVTFQATEDRPGILAQVAVILAEEGINLISAHSTPMGDVFRFVIALEQSRSSPQVQKALQRIDKETAVRVVL